MRGVENVSDVIFIKRTENYNPLVKKALTKAGVCLLETCAVHYFFLFHAANSQLSISLFSMSKTHMNGRQIFMTNMFLKNPLVS